MSSEDTLTRADIAELLNKQVGLSRAESAELVEQVLKPVNIGQTRQIAQRQRLVGQQRTRQQGKRRILRAGNWQGA